MKISYTLKTSILILGISSLLMVSACADLQTTHTDPATGGEQPTLSSVAVRFANVPIPNGFDLDRSKSFIYESGSGTVKVGNLHFKGWNGAEEVIEFFRNEMATKGWTAISIMEQKSTIMVYEQETQVCTIYVEPSLGRTSVQINVGPK